MNRYYSYSTFLALDHALQASYSNPSQTVNGPSCACEECTCVVARACVCVHHLLPRPIKRDLHFTVLFHPRSARDLNRFIVTGRPENP